MTNYIKYLKDNPKEYWFKRKLYGWGWVPVRWQGWLVVALFIAIIILSGLGLDDKPEPSASDLAWFFGKIIASVIILMIICYKTGEKPGWRWGLPKDEHDNKKIS